MNHFQDQGRALYKRGDYQNAIASFNRAIARGASVQLLDNRAACYEKLEDLPTALQDAKKAIQLQREDPTGYLRAGKIMTLMKKEPVALEIYTHGLRCVKHVGQGYEALRAKEKALMHKLKAPGSLDPFTVLPRELAEDILTYLSFQEQMKCCMVSPQWANFIRSCPDLWRHLDLSKAGRKVNNAFISRAINIGRHKLTKASLSHLSDFNKALAAIVRHCPLEDLTLLRNGLQARNVADLLKPATRLKRLVLSPELEFPSSQVPYLLRTLSEHLEAFQYTVEASRDVAHIRLNFSEVSCPRLRTLFLEHDYLAHKASNPDCVFGSISESLPALESLTILGMKFRTHSDAPGATIDVSKCAQLKNLYLETSMPCASSLRLPSTLVSLRLRNVWVINSSGSFWFQPGPAGAQAVTFFLPLLEEVHLNIAGMVMPNVQHLLTGEPEGGVGNPASPLSKLRKLTIIGGTLNYLQVSELFKHPRLESLELLNVPHLGTCGDDDVIGIVDSLSKLRSLDLSGTDITGVGVKRAVDSGHLEELIVNNCCKMNADAVEYARKKGVRVMYHMSPDGLNGGKKVRH